MAIVPSHFVWQRQRSDHHSGALRQYNTQGPTRFPRGPFASPVSCALCNCGSRLHRISSSQPSAQTTSYLNPFAPAFTFELTPPKASSRTAEEDKDEAPKLCCFCPEKLPSKGQRLFKSQNAERFAKDETKWWISLFCFQAFYWMSKGILSIASSDFIELFFILLDIH